MTREMVQEEDIQRAIMSAYALSLSVVPDIPNDSNGIPTLIRRAYFSSFGTNMPSSPVRKREYASISGKTITDLATMLTNISNRLGLQALAFIQRARALANGTELAPHGSGLANLPHTVLFALFLEAGSDPDLNRTDEELWDLQLDYRQRDKLWWFMCKKTYASCLRAAEDGEVVFDRQTNIGHCVVSGRLFEAMPLSDITRYIRVRVPPVCRAFGLGSPTVLVSTPRGVFGLDRATEFSLQFDEADPDFSMFSAMTVPVRVRFAQCPVVAEFEAALPHWHKDELVIEAAVGGGCIVITKAGVVAAGWVLQNIVGPDVALAERTAFHTVPLPTDFVPTLALAGEFVAVLGMGDRQMIGGGNVFGQLGLGHDNCTNQFHEAPFHVDRILFSGVFDLFQCGREIIMTGGVTSTLAESGLLPGCKVNDTCMEATPLAFTRPVRRFFCGPVVIATAYKDETVVIVNAALATGMTEVHTCTVPFEARAVVADWEHVALYVQADDGLWTSVLLGATNRGAGDTAPGLCPAGLQLGVLVDIDIAAIV
ncbi:hypothetical protein J8273_3458 [Carpediemonas membranifera]|uniref:Uncharacterized protein n=1 Tax=Carpediemonas membranifera TaxID=201153 RepID=A0A8J6DZ94_9EUKA|nr:hypothetical protein J8273_3458 [Carpediemonas membranifera]|eukprot:KAG9393324.1 hypothetical protein J8273_3458 [Carpediemonas membranifera]